MRYADAYTAITKLFEATNKVVPLIMGEPGGGKTALSKDIGKAFDFDKVIMLFASWRDPVDFMGTPDNKGDFTRWVPPEELYELREGRNLLVLDELTDALIPVQNTCCGLITERRTNKTPFSPETYIIATGNRTEDKSGAQRVITKLANRVMRIDYESNIDDWSSWAMDANVDPMLIQFLRFAPDLLSKFDPNAFASPTPRQWEAVSLIPDTIPFNVYCGMITGLTGPEASAKYATFKRLLDKMPNPDEVILRPDTIPVPEESGVRYALAGALARRVSKDNFGRIMKFIDRVPPELRVYFVKDSLKLVPEVRNSKEFVAYAVKNASLML